MKTFYINLILLLFINTLHAQNQANNWYFGDHAGITFNTNPPSYLPGSAMVQTEGCASQSDNSGNLLFYSNGVSVYCSNHTVMPNGTGLLGNNSTTQSCIILPLPGSTSIYYIITAPSYISSNSLAYSIVDMTLNGGLGDVTIKNSPLLVNSTEKLTAVRHQNGNDIWIIAHEYPGNSFHAFLLTAAGINITPVISSSGTAFTIPYNKVGTLKASPCGNNLAAAIFNTGGTTYLELYDFDNLTGSVSNSILLSTWIVSGEGYYGVEFSPDNSRLYATHVQNNSIFQYNLLAGSAAAIIASQATIGTSGTHCYALQTGPDGKIYVAKSTLSSLGCINSPNQLGASCNFTDNSLSIAPSTCLLGLPNFLTSLFCSIPSGVNSISQEYSASVYPNPFTDELIFKNNKNEPSEIILYDIASRKLLQQKFTNIITLNTTQLAKGMYLYEVINNKGVIKKGKVVKE
jgi:hypothetical protein